MKHEALIAALQGEPRPTEPTEPAEPVVPSFDGGARMSPPLPGPTHEQTLIALLRSGEGRW